jgi:hypothetical protein
MQPGAPPRKHFSMIRGLARRLGLGGVGLLRVLRGQPIDDQQDAADSEALEVVTSHR